MTATSPPVPLPEEPLARSEFEAARALVVGVALGSPLEQDDPEAVEDIPLRDLEDIGIEHLPDPLFDRAQALDRHDASNVVLRELGLIDAVRRSESGSRDGFESTERYAAQREELWSDLTRSGDQATAIAWLRLV